MDLETENRIAAILLKEAAELRRQSEREGALAYLKQPKARFRPNSRFLTATVLGAQQANKAVEVNEMWRVRQKEQELEERLKRSSGGSHRNSRIATSSTSRMNYESCSSSKRVMKRPYSTEDGGLRDEELEEFLHSRVKRGRGAVGSRMDETGPYLPPDQDSTEWLSSSHDEIGHRVVIGPAKPPSLKSCSEGDERRKKANKGHSRKHKDKAKEKSMDKEIGRSKNHKRG